MVDDADYEWLNAFKWHVNVGSRGTIYARRTVTIAKNKRQHLFMHCEVAGVKRGDGNEADHKDRDGLNNQRDNLRVCKHDKNMFNRKSATGSSRCRGVKRSGDKWRTDVANDYVGTYESEVAAAEAYDDAAREIAGEYAVLNFPDRESQQGELI